MTADSTTIHDVPCLGCGCACDDIRVVVRQNRIVESENACWLGMQWFGDGQTPSRSLVDGQDVSIEDAISAAAGALAAAKSPLVYLAPGISCEAQREATAVADVLRARLDSVTSATSLPLVLSAQERGFASSTLGEVRNRAGVVVFWAVDVEARYPRFRERYAPDPKGAFLWDPNHGRVVVAVDVGAAMTIDHRAGRRFVIAPADEIATLSALASLVRPPALAPGVRAPLDGPAWDLARTLAPILLEAEYIAIVYDGEPDDRAVRSSQRFDAITALSHALNDRTRCASIALRAGGNRSGADSVLTAQTGFPLAIDFRRGYPRYAPHDGSAAAVLARGEADVVLVVGDASLIPGIMIAELRTMRTIVVGSRASDSPLGSPSVSIDTGVAGIHSGGTALRTDDVPLPLRALVTGVPSAETVVAALTRALTAPRRRDTRSRAAAAAI